MQYGAEVSVPVLREILSFLLLNFGAVGSSSAEHVEPTETVPQCMSA